MPENLEKFMNYGLNANQTFKVYWPNLADHRDDFHPPIHPNIYAGNDEKFPQAGWYSCRLIKFKGVVYFLIFHFYINLTIDLILMHIYLIGF